MRRMGKAIGASAVLLLLALPGLSQDRKPEPAPTPAPTPAPAPAGAQQQDKIEIPKEALDSWYKVVQTVSGTAGSPEEKAVGYMHEVLVRTAGNSTHRYQYDLTGEQDVVLPANAKGERSVPEIHAVSIRAHLDDTFAPVYMERHDQKGAAMLPTAIYTEDNARRIEVTLSGERKSFSVNPDEEIFYSPFLMFIALRQSGALSRPGTRKAVLMVPREDGAPPYADVTLEIKEMVKRTVMGKKDVPVTPVSYLKPPPAPSREDELLTSYIDKYGRIVEEETRRGTRRLLVKTEKEALGDRPMIVSARRDPFWKEGAFMQPDVRRDPEKGPPPTIDDFEGNLAESKRLLEELAKLKAENREIDGDKVYDRILDLVTAMYAKHKKTPLLPAQLAQVEWVNEQAERVWGGVAKIMKKGQLIFARCTQMFERDDCPGMEAGLKELKELTGAKPIQNLPAKMAEIQRWIGQIEPLVVRCKTRIELAKKKIELTGTTLSESWEQVPVDIRLSAFGHQVGSVLDVRFVKPMRIAIINGKAYRVGDTVEGEGVRVEKVWAHGVQVSLRDETRDVGIRQ
jgi:hypothetical protein